MKLVYLLFHGLCHQIPSRALAAEGFGMPLCARCAGLNVGFLVGLVFFLTFARKRTGAPTFGYVAASCGGLVLFAGDCAANFLGIWNSPPALRFGVAMCAAMLISAYLAVLCRTAFAACDSRRPAATAVAAGVSVLVAGGAALLNARPSAALLLAETWMAAAGAVGLLLLAHATLLSIVLGSGRRVAFVVSPVTAGAQIALFSLLRSLAGV